MARHFRSGVDAMIREAELEELQKQWAKENERIMAESRIPDFTQVTADQDASSPPSVAEAAEQTPPPAFQNDPGAVAEPEQPAPAETPKGSSAA